MTFGTDGAGRFITAVTFFITFAVILQTVAAVITQLVIVIAGSAISAVMLHVAAPVSTFSAVITVVAQPVAVAVTAAVLALYTVLVGGSIYLDSSG